MVGWQVDKVVNLIKMRKNEEKFINLNTNSCLFIFCYLKKTKQGEFFFTDGSSYKGEFKEGQPAGQGNKEREREEKLYIT